ncbi:MAG TPA: DUF790 family protein [Armatimonadetes bacterium]|nr:DUF790 family protein [Armatimonadota bacterium]
MLPGNLLRFSLRGNRIRPKYLRHTENTLRVAQELIDLFASHVGRRWGELGEARSRYEADSPNYKVTRGLAKLLEERSEFALATELEPAELRARLFARAAQRYPLVTTPDRMHSHTPAEVIREVAAEYQVSEEHLRAAMYADLEENRILHSFDPPTPKWLLDRYNVALAQAMLYRATRLEIWISRNLPTKYRKVFQFVKFFQLMHTVTGNHKDGYYILLDGPASIFRLSQKYGVQMALFLPALLLCDRWIMRAEIYLRGMPYYFILADKDGLKSHYRDAQEFDSEVERVFFRKFARQKTGGWRLERETAIINLKDTVMIPDFAVVHADGRRALMEIVGFWTPEYLRRKLDKLRRAGRADMIVAVSEHLNCSEEDFADVPGEVLFFKTGIDVKAVIERAERCAVPG